MYPDYNLSPVFHPQHETGSEQFTHCLTSSVREEVEKMLLMMALSPIPLTCQNRGCRARYSSNLQLWAERAEFKLLRSSGLLIAALLWDTTEGRQAHNERCAAATCMLETGYGEENSEGNSSLNSGSIICSPTDNYPNYMCFLWTNTMLMEHFCLLYAKFI